MDCGEIGAQDDGQEHAEETAATVTGTSEQYATPTEVLGQRSCEGRREPDREEGCLRVSLSYLPDLFWPPHISAAHTNVALVIPRAVCPSGLRRAECAHKRGARHCSRCAPFWNSLSHGCANRVLRSVPAFLPGSASADTSVLR